MAMAHKVLVVGSGGIGALYGALLHKAGWQVEMVARSDHNLIRQQGLKITSVLGDLSFRPARTFAKVEEAGIADWILLAVKMLPNTDLVSLIHPAVGPDTKICLIANGLDIEMPLAQAFPTNSLVSAVAFVGSTRIRAGEIEHSAYGNLIIGSYLPGAEDACRQLAEALNRTGIRVNISQDIQHERWKKSIWNASFNPLSVAANGADTGKLLGSAEAESLVRNLMAEVVAIGRAEGYELPDALIDKNIATTLAMPPYLTSMAQDYLNHHPIELEALVGSVLRYAHKHALAVPHLNTLYQTLRLRS